MAPTDSSGNPMDPNAQGGAMPTQAQAAAVGGPPPMPQANAFAQQGQGGQQQAAQQPGQMQEGQDMPSKFELQANELEFA
jgi:hypothetical protein